MPRLFTVATVCVLAAIVALAVLAPREKRSPTLAERFPQPVPTSPAAARSDSCRDDVPIGAPRGFNLQAKVPEDAVLQVRYTELGRCGSLLLVDGATGESLPGFAPINAGHSSFGRVSPDGSLFAVSINPSGSSSGAEQLHLYDLRAWRPLFAVDHPRLRGELAWSPDSRYLYVLEWDGGALWRVDSLTGSAEKVRDTGLSGRLFVSADGATLYVFGWREANPTPDRGYSPWRETDEPFLAAIDTASWQETRRLTLPSVSTESSEIGLNPGAAYSPADNRLYIAHADSEAVTVVDLDSFESQDYGLNQARRASLPSRLAGALAGLFVSSAEAKGGDYADRTAVVSADGRYLYTAGSRFTEEEGLQPLGLLVFDTATMQVVSREPAITTLWPSTDGGLVAATAFTSRPGEDFATYQVIGPRLIDAERGALLGEPSVATWDGYFTHHDVAFSRDGRYLHFVRYLSHGRPLGSDPPDCPDRNGCTELTIVDARTGDPVRRLRIDGVSIFLPVR